MSSPAAASPLNALAQALLQRVTGDRDRRCAERRAAAESQARKIVHSARVEARNDVRSAVMQERARMDLGVRQATARADIEVRRRERQKSRALLEHMWTAIAGSLETRWGEPALRRAWIEAAISQAGALLAGGAWLIEVGAAGCIEQERDELALRARARGAATVAWSVDAGLAAGLRIRTAGVCVDATVPGLLARRDAIEAAFLAEYLPASTASEAAHV